MFFRCFFVGYLRQPDHNCASISSKQKGILPKCRNEYLASYLLTYVRSLAYLLALINLFGCNKYYIISTALDLTACNFLYSALVKQIQVHLGCVSVGCPCAERRLILPYSCRYIFGKDKSLGLRIRFVGVRNNKLCKSKRGIM